MSAMGTGKMVFRAGRSFTRQEYDKCLAKITRLYCIEARIMLISSTTFFIIINITYCDFLLISLTLSTINTIFIMHQSYIISTVVKNIVSIDLLSDLHRR